MSNCLATMSNCLATMSNCLATMNSCLATVNDCLATMNSCLPSMNDCLATAGCIHAFIAHSLIGEDFILMIAVKNKKADCSNNNTKCIVLNN